MKLLTAIRRKNFPRRKELYSALSLNSVIDCEKLDDFFGHSISLNDNGETLSFDSNSNSNHNRYLLGWGLDYIRDRYRNKAGHSEFIEKTDAEKCRQLLIQGENLLWILLYIIR